jgi:hypothetical protein
MKKLLFLLLVLQAFISCQKDQTDPPVDNNITGKYYFQYTVDGKSNGYAFSVSMFDAIPSTDWSNLYSPTGGFEITGGVFPNLIKGPGVLYGTVQSGIQGQYSGCMVDGKAKCFTGSISIDNMNTGTYTVTYGLNALTISEATTSSQLTTLVGFLPQNIQPGENMTVVITSIGNIGEIIKGEFNGNVKNANGVLVSVSGKFSVPRTN